VRHGQKKSIKKVVPSGGSRHPFETYLVINRVENITSGIYRYLFLENKLLFISETDESVSKLLSQLSMGQDFVGKSAVFFMWSVLPYRTEWRYSLISYKGILIEAGHICQNLYLACESTNLGTCAILSYDQKRIDRLLSLDGQEEFIIYVASVGKVKS
ncbi:MAG: SagB/ThcOx family dehydrogenase, partial [Candidatus Hodarchaeales archaeon]